LTRIPQRDREEENKEGSWVRKGGGNLAGPVLAFCLFAVLGWSQGNLGGLTGTVTDASGAVVPDVEIVLRNLATK
jgi:hypothetical protein